MRDQSAYAATTSCIDTGSVTMMIINGHDAFRRFTGVARGQGSGLVAVKRAVRVTLAACVAFYFSLYVLDDTQMATFAAFGCISLGALSEVQANHGSAPGPTVLRCLRASAWYLWARCSRSTRGQLLLGCS